MDVKVGTGAFMTTIERARELSTSIINTAANLGVRTHTLITDMNEVLGTTAGNALEIEESVLFLRNQQRETRLNEVVMGLCAEMLLVGGIEEDRDAAARMCDEAVTSGHAAEVFDRMVNALGGPADFVADYSQYLARAPVVRQVHATGTVTAMNTRAVGGAIIELGGGRHVVGEKLDLSVGFSNIAPIGTELDGETPLAVIHAASEDAAAAAEKHLLEAVSLGDKAPPATPVIHEILTG
jgi:thymidine phosphorylase